MSEIHTEEPSSGAISTLTTGTTIPMLSTSRVEVTKIATVITRILTQYG